MRQIPIDWEAGIKLLLRPEGVTGRELSHAVHVSGAACTPTLETKLAKRGLQLTRKYVVPGNRKSGVRYYAKPQN